jgi:RNA polymerase sigma factor (sigma-70 family)
MTATASLTKREREVLRLAGEDLATKQIAKQLGISVSTVKVYAGRARQKLGAATLPRAVLLAVRHGIITPN